MSASTAIGYRPEAGSATRRSANAPSRPASSPIAAPAASSYTTIPAMSAGPGACALVPLSSVTASTAGGSLSPDSASSVPDSRGGSGSLRRTENTAAASVGASTAPSRKASRQPSDSSQWDTSATTRMLTATPTVARTSAAGAAARACSQLVVRPPSARISTSALSPSACASSALSNLMPRPASPRARPRPRKRRRPGRPIPCATRAATIAAITTTAPTSRIRLGSPAFNAASAWPYPGPELVVNSLPDRRSPPRVQSRGASHRWRGGVIAPRPWPRQRAGSRDQPASVVTSGNGACGWTLGRALLQPVEHYLGDLVPAVVDRERVTAVGELPEVRDAG